MNESLEQILEFVGQHLEIIVGGLTAIATIIGGIRVSVLAIKKAITKVKDLHTSENLQKVNAMILDLQKQQAEFESKLLENIALKVENTIDQYNEKKKEIAVKILTLPQEEKAEEIEPVIEEEKEDELL